MYNFVRVQTFRERPKQASIDACLQMLMDVRDKINSIGDCYVNFKVELRRGRRFLFKIF
jgi:hypothetical protein